MAASDMLLSAAAAPPPRKDTADDHDPDTIFNTDKLSYEIFSILESKFLFGYDDPHHPPPPPSSNHTPPPPPPPSVKTQRGKVRILSIDGAAMRGILPAKALSHLEQSLMSASGDPHARISDYFDLTAGTGVGGLFAAMLFATRDSSTPLFRAEDASRLLADKARRFYSPPSSSSSASILRCFNSGGKSSRGRATAAAERALKEAFGEDLTLRDTLKPVLIPCYDLRTSAPLVFSRADALESSSYDFRLWEVCRATWAEPGRFEPADIRSVDGATACVGVDGGLAMSNPTAAAITHVLHNKQEFPFVRGVEDLMVLSLGCGAPNAAGGELDISKARQWGTREWARPIARIASDGAADLVDQAVALAFGRSRSSNYVRIQADGSTMAQCAADSDCDPSPTNIKVLLGAAEEMLKQKNVESVMFGGKRIADQTNEERLDWFACELVLEHQRRSCRIAPTVAFKQAPPKQATPKSNS